MSLSGSLSGRVGALGAAAAALLARASRTLPAPVADPVGADLESGSTRRDAERHCRISSRLTRSALRRPRWHARSATCCGVAANTAVNTAPAQLVALSTRPSAAAS